MVITHGRVPIIAGHTSSGTIKNPNEQQIPLTKQEMLLRGSIGLIICILWVLCVAKLLGGK